MGGIGENRRNLTVLESHDFLTSLGFKDESPDYDHVERVFLDRLKERIAKVQNSFDKNEISEADRWIRDFHRQFFDYSLQWIIQQARAHQKTSNHPEAPRLKKEARNVLDDLQKGIIEFASCSLHLSRYMTVIRDEIRKEEARGYFHAPKGTKWTSDTGILINRYKKRKREIKQISERYGRVRKVLKNVDVVSIRKNLTALFGPDKGESYQRRMISSLRVGDFKKARALCEEVKTAKKRFSLDRKTAEQLLARTLKQMNLLIKVVEENREALGAEDGKLYLRAEELNVILDTNEQETVKMDQFLAKYHLPYMQYKLDTIQHLRDKLLVFGSLESLLTLYKKLISGIAAPIPDIKTLRQFENDALDRVRYLLDGHFQDVPKIRGWADDAVEEFRENRDEYKEIAENLEAMEKQAPLADENRG